MTKNEPDFVDRDQIYRERFDARLRAELKALVTPELIEEHRQKPLGRHSDALDRLLVYFRRAPVDGKYALYEIEVGRKYKVIEISTLLREPPQETGGEVYTDKNEALHAVFLKRVEQLMNS